MAALGLFTASCAPDELVDPTKTVKVLDSEAPAKDTAGGATSDSQNTTLDGGNPTNPDAQQDSHNPDSGVSAVKLTTGEPTKAVASDGALFLSTDGASVFWTNAAARSVHRYDPEGATSTLHTEGTGFLPWDIAIGTGVAYFGSRGKTLYYVRKVPTKGGHAGTAATVKPQMSVQMIRRMTTDGTFVYFVTGSGDGPTYLGLVRRTDPDEAETINIAQYQKEPTSISVDGDYAYWTTRQGPAVWRIPKDGTDKPKIIVQDKSGALDLTVSDGFVYYINEATADSGGTVARAPFAGGLPVVLVGEQTSPLSIAADAKYVYWVTRGTAEKGFADGAVWRVNKGGGTTENLAKNMPQPWDIGLLKGQLYWTCRGAAGAGGGLWGMNL